VICVTEYRLGQIVTSIKGKDAGRAYVVVGLPDPDRREARLALADAGRFSVDRPKLKNPKHVQATSRVMEGVASEDGVCVVGNIDRGRFCSALSDLGGRGANGA
jgi:ribosomal protein L14E/L6E/L27E